VHRVDLLEQAFRSGAGSRSMGVSRAVCLRRGVGVDGIMLTSTTTRVLHAGQGNIFAAVLAGATKRSRSYARNPLTRRETDQAREELA